MNKFKVTILPDTESPYSVEIDAHGYETQATQGAGMIADFYEASSSKPFATFAKVLSVQRTDYTKPDDEEPLVVTPQTMAVLRKLCQINGSPLWEPSTRLNGPDLFMGKSVVTATGQR